MSITFSSDGTYFTVLTDDKRICGEHKYMTETWYQCPLPAGLDNGVAEIRLNDYPATHWLVRRPLPPLPKAKTQAELDEEAFATAYHKRFPHLPTPGSDEGCARFMWNAALNYARTKS